MSIPPLPALPGSHSVNPAPLPVAIDYPAALALRQMAQVHDDYPKYLLAPEISALLHYVPDLHRKMLIATLWNTGARINEALALTRENFSLAPPTRSRNWPRSSNARKKPPERLADFRGVTPHTAWYRCPIRSTSRSCRRWWPR